MELSLTKQMPLLSGFDQANLFLNYQLIRKRSFSGLLHLIVLVDGNHFVLIAMKYTCADHLEEMVTPVSQ